ncbi:response regulator [Sphingomonas sabuli]|uniref:Response regulator n=1 Tax=Sphingomonas sabuli TaxID=2764186 RepID=A0A7G9L1J2_9SPHN|nr:response regulator [Sphingomonas sabuli]QNM82491.1 response regulator [Sphingomonas sabuli]
MTKTVLVCDDDALLVDIVRFRLTSRGYDVDVASDGGDALARIEARRPDAIVLDSMMPVMDGMQLLRRLQENADTRDIPVMMLSARKQEADVVGALALGASDYMVKPFSPEELVARLTRLLEQAE